MVSSLSGESMDEHVYKLVDVSVFMSGEAMLKQLHYEHSQGWEYVGSVRMAHPSVSVGGEFIRMTFKRIVG